MNGLDALSLVICWREGPLKPPNRSFRNNNCGNIRNPSWPTKDAEGYDIYPDFIAGYEALQADLEGKLTGHNSHGLTPASTIADLFKIYAPAEDSNDPASYAAFAAGWCQLALGRPITPATTLGALWTPS